ncbi:MAG: hypothetical protein LKJ17_06780 [Oscillospiraceae bacterium]|jgi:hypothetical protein|nr:hypothetical protein [Oscillospiraceae bacterium]
MADQLGRLLESDKQAKEYFDALPYYTRDEVKKHAGEIESAASLKLFVETFTQNDSFRGA